MEPEARCRHRKRGILQTGCKLQFDVMHSLAHELSIFRAGELGSKDMLQMESNGEPHKTQQMGRLKQKWNFLQKISPKERNQTLLLKGILLRKKKITSKMGTLLQLLQNYVQVVMVHT